MSSASKPHSTQELLAEIRRGLIEMTDMPQAFDAFLKVERRVKELEEQFEFYKSGAEAQMASDAEEIEALRESKRGLSEQFEVMAAQRNTLHLAASSAYAHLKAAFWRSAAEDVLEAALEATSFPTTDPQLRGTEKGAPDPATRERTRNAHTSEEEMRQWNEHIEQTWLSDDSDPASRSSDLLDKDYEVDAVAQNQDRTPDVPDPATEPKAGA